MRAGEGSVERGSVERGNKGGGRGRGGRGRKNNRSHFKSQRYSQGRMQDAASMSISPGSFLGKFTNEVSRSIHNDYRDNYDEYRFGPEPLVSRRHRIKGWIRSV